MDAALQLQFEFCDVPLQFTAQLHFTTAICPCRLVSNIPTGQSRFRLNFRDSSGDYFPNVAVISSTVVPNDLANSAIVMLDVGFGVANRSVTCSTPFFRVLIALADTI